ncbi:hypothetical protein ACFL0Y_00075 [Patescibacteria group bacterium]
MSEFEPRTLEEYLRINDIQLGDGVRKMLEADTLIVNGLAEGSRRTTKEGVVSRENLLDTLMQRRMAKLPIGELLGGGLASGWKCRYSGSDREME